MDAQTVVVDGFGPRYDAVDHEGALGDELNERELAGRRFAGGWRRRAETLRHRDAERRRHDAGSQKRRGRPVGAREPTIGFRIERGHGVSITPGGSYRLFWSTSMKSGFE